LKEAVVTLTWLRRPLKTCLFVANISDKFILGLDVLRARDTAVDLKRLELRLGRESAIAVPRGATVFTPM
jgi:hypothetical protein